MTCLVSVKVANQCTSKHLSRRVLLNDSTCALSVGFPGREKSMRTWLTRKAESIKHKSRLIRIPRLFFSTSPNTHENLISAAKVQLKESVLQSLNGNQ